MKTSLLRAAGLGALLAAAAFSSANAADSKPTLTGAVQTNLAAAQTAAAKGDTKTALDSIAKAEAVSGRKPYDDLMIALIKTTVEIKAGDLAAADAAAEAAADNPAIPDEQKSAVYTNGLVLSLNAQHLDKALVYAKQLEAMNPTDVATLNYIAQTYNAKQQYPAAIAAYQKMFAAAKATNTKVDRNAYMNYAAAQQATNDQAGVVATFETMVQAYSDPSDWTQLIDLALGTQGLRDLDAVYLGRLLIATNAAITPQQASIIGSTASHQTFYGDAEVMKEHGGTGYPDPAAAAAKDKAGIPALLATAAKDKNGGLLFAKVAQAQYSYGMYADAEASARQAATKGGDPDKSEPQMVLGMALAGQGKYQDAIAAFQTVTGAGPATQRAAQLWIFYCNTKLAPSPAPATAAAAPAK